MTTTAQCSAVQYRIVTYRTINHHLVAYLQYLLVVVHYCTLQYTTVQDPKGRHPPCHLLDNEEGHNSQSVSQSIKSCFFSFQRIHSNVTHSCSRWIANLTRSLTNLTLYSLDNHIPIFPHRHFEPWTRRKPQILVLNRRARNSGDTTIF